MSQAKQFIEKYTFTRVVYITDFSSRVTVSYRTVIVENKKMHENKQRDKFIFVFAFGFVQAGEWGEEEWHTAPKEDRQVPGRPMVRVLPLLPVLYRAPTARGRNL